MNFSFFSFATEFNLVNKEFYRATSYASAVSAVVILSVSPSVSSSRSLSAIAELLVNKTTHAVVYM